MVAKARHRPRLSPRQRLCMRGCRRDASGRERRDGPIERRLRAHLQPDRLLHGVTHLIDQRVVAKIGSERGLLVVPLDQLQPEDTLGEIDRGRQVARAQTDVTQLLDLNHAQLSVGCLTQDHCRSLRALLIAHFPDPA